MRRALLLAALPAVAGVACQSTPKGGEPSVQSLAFSLRSMSGEEVSLADARGRVVLVDIWATWCEPCEDSFPFYADLYERHHDAGFDLLAVSVDEDDADVARFLERLPVPFTVLRDPEGTVPAQIRIPTMPTAVLVGRGGRVEWVHAGFVPSDEETIEERVVAELSEAAP